MMLVDNAFQRVLQIAMGLLEVVVFVSSSDGAVVEQLEGQRNRYAVILNHGRPLGLDVLEDLGDLSLGIGFVCVLPSG
jgi:hypothetical protein